MSSETSNVAWTRPDLIGIEPLTRAEIELVLDAARAFKKTMDRSQKKLPTLRGKTIINLFLEPSTRTRVAFEAAATRLSADVIYMQGEASSTIKGESLRDTAQTLQALNADMIVLRHKAPGSSLYLSRILKIPVINAGDGAHEHPTQALLDAFTLAEHFNKRDGTDTFSLAGKKVTILGDILFSRVARSNLWCLSKLGAKVTLGGPRTLVPREEFEACGVTVSHRLEEAVAEADAVMLLRVQKERQTSGLFPSLGEYTSLFGLNRARLSLLKEDAIIMHPGPINRGVEIDSDLADSPRSVILDQVTNGVAVRMAALYLCAAAAGYYGKG
jgi:aspartate carbamoyltransferase catalytic subunit